MGTGHAARNATACNILSRFFFQAEDGIRDYKVTGVQTCALPILFDWPSPGKMVANGAALVTTDVPTLQNVIIPPWRSLRISAANGQITFQYGDYPDRKSVV